jgi:hypothetical protein
LIITALMWLTVHPAADSWPKLRSSAGTTHGAVSAGKPS